MALPADLLRLDTPARQDLVIVQGDGPKTIPLDLTYDDGSPFPLTGATVLTAQVYAAPGDTSPLCSLTVTPVDLALGQLALGYDQAASSALALAGTERTGSVGIWYLRVGDGTHLITTHIGDVTLIRPK